MQTMIDTPASLKQLCKDAMSHAITLLRLSHYRVQAYWLWELITDSPDNLAEAGHPEMHKMSLCGERIADLSKRIEYFPVSDQQAFAEAKHFFLTVLPSLCRPSRQWLNAAVDAVLDAAQCAESQYERIHGYGSLDRDREFIPLMPTAQTNGHRVVTV